MATARDTRNTRKPKPKAKAEPRRWSHEVTEHSDALDLREGVFKQKDPKAIAASLKDSAEHSDRRKSDPYRSAMSMLTFYINRAGEHLPTTQKKRLEAAKDELRELFHKPTVGRATPRGRKTERPAEDRAPGPSGQAPEGQKQKRHTNK
jgi:hypothetical protein